MAEKYVILIAGPTAVGKSAVALQLAQHFGTAIVSADARQCFREMNIGTAKPSAAELAAVPHYFINTHSIQDTISAGKYEQLALSYLADIFLQKNIAILCGGTGLYVKALLEGMDDMPAVADDVQAAVERLYAEEGFERLKAALAVADTTYAATGNMENPARMMRALAFYRAHQRSIISYQVQATKARPFKVIGIGLERPRAELYAIINRRVDEMVDHGLVEEAAALFPYRHHKSLATVGYREFYEQDTFPTDPASIQHAIEKIKQHSRNYAKRQLTWFKNKHDLTWFHPNDMEQILTFIERSMALNH